MRKFFVVLGILCALMSSAQAGGKGNGKGQGGNTTPTPFVDGFNDEKTPGVLCAWEQLNPCEDREIFVQSETKRANGRTYYFDYDAAQQGHVDICMREKDAPTGLVIYGLYAEPINLQQENGCDSPCNLLLRPEFVNRLSCHENVTLDQSQEVLNYYSIETLRGHTRQGDNYFCHEDYLPPNITPAQCLASTSRYCFRNLQEGESGNEFELYLAQCLSSNWTE